jgi:phosphoribosylaminoimidazole-succinocarboxamide synthase
MNFTFVLGVDCSGKTTTVKLISRPEVVERNSEIDDLTLNIDHKCYPEKFTDNVNDRFVVLTASPETLWKRISKRKKVRDIYESKRSLYYFNRRYLELAAYYGWPVIETDNMSKREVAMAVLSATPRLPLRDLTPAHVSSRFKLLVEGESKKVYEIPDDPGHCYIVLKNTIYSHSKQSTGEIEELGKIRGEGTRYFLEMMNRDNLDHAYIAVNNNGVIYAKRITNMNPLEVVVKEYCEGTDKHSFYKFRSQYADEKGRYKHGPYVRFDWRNPNHLDDNGVDIRESMEEYYKIESEMGKEQFFKQFLKRPMGDKAISDHIVQDVVVDVPLLRDIALRLFYTIRYHFKRVGLVIKDVCFMIDNNGVVWSEVNQDCMRIESSKETLDKDIWRQTGSLGKEKLLEKWQYFNDLMHGYFKKEPYGLSDMYKFWERCYDKSMAEVIERVGTSVTHSEIYMKHLRAGPRKYIVIHPDNRFRFSHHPDLLVDFKEEDLELYKSFYPHVLVATDEEATMALQNSARRIRGPKSVMDKLPSQRKVTKYVHNVKDLITKVTMFGGEWWCMASTLADVEKIWRLGSIPIVTEAVADKIWPLCFKVVEPTFIVQDLNGVVRGTFKGQPPIDLKEVRKILVNRETFDSCILVVERCDMKHFSNQFSVKVNIADIQKSIPANQGARNKLIQSLWKLDTDPSLNLYNFLSYLNSQNLNVTDVLNDLNAQRWDITKKRNVRIREVPIIALTSEKYLDGTIKFAREVLGFEIIKPENKRSLSLSYRVVDEDKVPFNGRFRLFPCRPKDIPWLFVLNRIDGAITYNTIIDNNPGCGPFVERTEQVDKSLSLCLIKKRGVDIPSTNPTVAAEHYNLIPHNVSTNIDVVMGSSESYLVNCNDYHLCDAVVQTGGTLDANNLEIHSRIPIDIKIGYYQK